MIRKALLPLGLVFIMVLAGPLASRPASARAPQPANMLDLQNYALPQSASAPPGVASQPNLYFKCLTAGDGLAFSLVTSILQDQRGFLWFGTRGGLNKYDGNNFTVYLPATGDDFSLGNYIYKIYQDRNEDMWLSTYSGLVRWDKSTGEFIHYKYDSADPNSLSPGRPFSVMEDASGTVWVATTGGLNRFDPATGKFTRFFQDPMFVSLYSDRAGGIWLGTSDGLWYFSSGSIEGQDPLIYRNDPAEPASLSNDIVNPILEDQHGFLWVGTDGGGLNRLDRSSGKFTRFTHDPDDPFSLSDNMVYSLLEDDRGRLWIGTKNGLNLFDHETNRFFQYHANPNDPNGMRDDVIDDIFQDSSGVVWFTTLAGVCKVNETASQFTFYAEGSDQTSQAGVTRPGTVPALSDGLILSVYQDSQGILWIGTSQGGLNRLDRSTGEVEVFRNDPEDPASISDGEIYSIYEDEEGILWIGTQYGLDRFIPQSGSFEHVPEFQGVSVNYIIQDRLDNLWMATSNGLLRRDHGTSTFTDVPLTNDPSSNQNITQLLEDHTGALWIAIQNGKLFRLDPAAEGETATTIINFPNDLNDPRSPGITPISSMYEDFTGTIWLGSVDGRLLRFNRDTQTFTRFIPETIGKHIGCILGDEQGFLWMSNVLGLARFDPRTEIFSYFDARDGLVIGEGTRNCMQTDQGEMFFNTMWGLVSFYPERISLNPNPPDVVITSLNLNSRPIRTDLLPGEQITLPYKDNYLSFDFSALDYTAPAKNQYAYKMEGVDIGWVQSGTRHHADYPGLNPGTYTFHVKASNSSGTWNEQGVAVHITITPPFWQTEWFIGLVGLALAGAIASGVWLRLKYTETRRRELETQVASRTRELVTLNEIAAILNRPVDLLWVLQEVLDRVLEITRVEAGGIYLLDEKTQVLNLAAHRGCSSEFIREINGLQVGEGFSGHVVQSGESLVLQDVSDDPRLTRMVVREEGFHSLVIVPLKSRDQVRGTLFALTHERREFTRQVIQLLESIGHQVGAAVENAGLYLDTKNQVAQLTALQETAKAVASTLELNSLLELIVQQATTLLKADGGFINLADWNRMEDEVAAVSGIVPPVVGVRAKLESSLSGWVTIHNQAVIVNDIPNDQRVTRVLHSWVKQEHIQSAAAAPLVFRDQVKGTLLVIGRQEGKGKFIQEDLDLLVSFANQAAIAIENAHLYEQSKKLAVVEERNRLARELHDAVTQTLFSASLVAEALPSTWEKDPREGRGLLQELRALSRGALAEMRTLLLELRPAALLETSLADLLRQLGEAASGRTGIPVNVKVEGQLKLPPDVQIAFYRITQEALNNVTKHSHAQQASVRLCYSSQAPGSVQSVLLSIVDDGRGFDPDKVHHDRLGLGIMQERAQAIGAILKVESQPGQGTRLNVQWKNEERQEEK